jgi:hypothetical protein
MSDTKVAVKKHGDDGENLTLQPGRGGPPHMPSGKPGTDGKIILALADGTEIIRVEPCGRVYVKGHEVAGNHRIYEAFRGWVLASLPTE